mmetsp:Transcript_29983/g.69774  ORF Transcript_29983/g.69774 Transcript_29983/m.69774 type:complete len:230 (-) Transcript_29983:267-956(-)
MLNTTDRKKKGEESTSEALAIKLVSAHCAQLMLAAATAINIKSQADGMIQPRTKLFTPPPMQFAKWKVRRTAAASSPKTASLLTHSKAAAVSTAAATETKYPYVLVSFFERVPSSAGIKPRAAQAAVGAMTTIPAAPMSRAHTFRSSSCSFSTMRASTVPMSGCKRDTSEVTAKGVVLAASLYASTAPNPNAPRSKSAPLCSDFCKDPTAMSPTKKEPMRLIKERKKIC